MAVITLTLGIGANTAIFSLLYQILLRPLPYPDAERLVFVWNTYPGIDLAQASVSIPDYIDRKTQAPAIEDAALFTTRTANLNEGGNPEQLRALAVTPSFFSTLGSGSRFSAAGSPRTKPSRMPTSSSILTYALWTSRFGADRRIVGRDIRINGESVSRRRRAAGRLRAAVARNRVARAVLVHAGSRCPTRRAATSSAR